MVCRSRGSSHSRNDKSVGTVFPQRDPKTSRRERDKDVSRIIIKTIRKRCRRICTLQRLIIDRARDYLISRKGSQRSRSSRDANVKLFIFLSLKRSHRTHQVCSIRGGKKKNAKGARQHKRKPGTRRKHALPRYPGLGEISPPRLHTAQEYYQQLVRTPEDFRADRIGSGTDRGGLAEIFYILAVVRRMGTVSSAPRSCGEIAYAKTVTALMRYCMSKIKRSIGGRCKMDVC